MSSTSKNDVKSCCSMERKRLVDDIRVCDFCSTSWEEHHRCLSRAAKKSGQRSRSSCVIS